MNGFTWKETENCTVNGLLKSVLRDFLSSIYTEFISKNLGLDFVVQEWVHLSVQ